MLETVGEVMGNKRKYRKEVKGLPCKKWFDEQCKQARKSLQAFTGDAYICAAKGYHALIQKKKRAYVVQIAATNAHTMARNPKRIWNEIRMLKEEVTARHLLRRGLACVCEKTL